MNSRALNPILVTLLSVLSLLAFAGPGLANDYPHNPYSDRSKRGVRSSPRLPELDRREFPQGLRGPRQVHIEVTAADRRRIEQIIIDRARANDQQFKAAIDRHDETIRDYGQRLSTMQMNRDRSRADFSRWLDYRGYVRELKRAREQLRLNRESNRKIYRDQVRWVRRSGPTTVVWNVRNHQRRVYVPQAYLRDKAIRYLAEHLSALGRTTRLSF